VAVYPIAHHFHWKILLFCFFFFGETVTKINLIGIFRLLYITRVCTSSWEAYMVTQKFGTLFIRLITSLNIDPFSEFFNVRIMRTFVIILLLKIPPHLKCVATLPCEMLMSPTIENKTFVTTHFNSASSSSKADTLNIWCKNCRISHSVTSDNNWCNKHVVSCC